MKNTIIIISCLIISCSVSKQVNLDIKQKVLLEIRGVGFFIKLNKTSKKLIKKTYENEYLEITRMNLGRDTILVKEYKHDVLRSQRQYVIRKRKKSKRLKTFDSTTFEPSREKIYYHKLKPIGTWIFHDELGYIIRREEH